jgi:hypothetical protein
MKNTKKNGAKRNPVLVLAVLGLLVGAGATGAFAAGIVPSIDTGVSGSVSATVTTVAPMTVTSADDNFHTYASDGNDVKFTDTIDIIAPGSQTVNITVTINRMVENANSVLINMDGMSQYVRSDLTGTVTHGSIVRMGSGEWAITGTGIVATDTLTLTFKIYVSQQTDLTPLNNVWDFTISEVNI